MSKRFTRSISVLVGLSLVFALASVVSAAGGQAFRGRLVEFHGDDFARGRSATHGYALETSGGGGYALRFRDPALVRLVGQHVELVGARQGRTLTVASYKPVGADSTATSSATTTAATTASTTKNVAVILINFRNDTRQPWTTSFVAGVMFSNANSVANYFAESSYGQWAMTGKVMGWYTIDYDNVGCSYSAWASAARSAASAAGESLTGYTNYVYAFPSAPGCGWSGLAYLPGTESWLNNAMNLRVPAHELSHNFGVHHAATINCSVGGVRVALSDKTSDCTLSEYGDPFTILGSAATRHSHSMHKAQMGWVPAGERQNVTTAGAYALGVQEHSAASPKVLRIARTGASNQYFYLEFRQPHGSYFDNFSASDPAVTGVSVRVGPDYPTRSQSWLVDTTPATSSFADAPLAVGRTFSDPLSGVSVTTQSVGPDGAVVRIDFGADDQPPTPPADLAATSVAATSLSMAWSASSDNHGVAGYRVFRNGALLAATSSTSWSDGGLTAATSYTYAVVAYDAAGNVSDAATLNATTLAVDTTPPSAPSNLKAAVTKKGVTNLSWTAATDNVAVTGYRLYRNGSLFATVTTTTYSARKVRGTFSWYVIAYDAAGNTSAASNTVTVTVR